MNLVVQDQQGVEAISQLESNDTLEDILEDPMKKEAYIPALGRRVVLALGLLILPLSVVSQTEAKVQSNLDSGQYSGSKRVVFMNLDDLTRLAKRSGLKVHKVKFVKFSKHDLERLAKLSSNGCGCALPEEAAGKGWDCFKGCLETWGVPSPMIWACVAACTAGPISCIACLGIAEYIVAGCNLWCVWPPWNAKNVEPAPDVTPKSKPNQTHPVQVVKLSPRSAHSGLTR